VTPTCTISEIIALIENYCSKNYLYCYLWKINNENDNVYNIILGAPIVLPAEELEHTAGSARNAAFGENVRTRQGFFSSAPANIQVPDPLGLQQLPVTMQPAVINIQNF
jgi:hypothetical protein